MPRRHEALRFAAFSAALCVLATLVLVAGVMTPFAARSVGLTGVRDQVVFAVMLVSALAAEIVDVVLPGAGSLSLGAPIGMAATVYLGPLYAGGIALISMVPYLTRAASGALPRRLANTALVVTTASLPGLIYLYAGGVPLRVSTAQTSFWPLVLAGVSGPIINMGLGSIGQSLFTGRPWREAVIQGIAWMLPSSLALSFLGIAMAQVLRSMWLSGLALFVVPLLVARQTYQRSVQLRDAYADTISSLVAALEAKDVYTKGHSLRVAKYAMAIAHGLQMPEKQAERLEWAALLHDIGKVGVSRRVLAKNAKLSAEEYTEIKQHPAIGARILADVPYLADLVPSIEAHHERLDGSGYGRGVRGEDIPLDARILAVADAFDAMTSTRPYREAMAREAAIAELNRCSGTQFDGDVVVAFLAELADGTLMDEASAL